MGSLDSMKEKLMPLGIYDLSQGGAAEHLLSACAPELDALYDALDVMTRECFIETAQDYGLAARERFGGREREGDGTQERRAALLDREVGYAFDGTPGGFEDCVRSLGVTDFSVDENVSKGRVDLTVNDTLTPGEQSLFEKRLRAQFPIYANLVLRFQA